MSLTLRPHSINLYAYSKLLYRCNYINLKIADVKQFTKYVKSFLYADLLEKPDLLTLFIDNDKGGLGLLCIQTRATAALIFSFLKIAICPDFNRNFYHNILY